MYRRQGRTRPMHDDIDSLIAQAPDQAGVQPQLPVRRGLDVDVGFDEQIDIATPGRIVDA